MLSRDLNSLVVGIGSSHGTDTIGWEVARWLERESIAHWDVKLAMVPSDLLDWLDGRQALALIDAARLVELEPDPQRNAAFATEPNAQGSVGIGVVEHDGVRRAAAVEVRAESDSSTWLPRVTRLSWPDPRVIASFSSTVHDLNLTQVLQLADRLGWLPPRVELWAVHVDSDPGNGLSDEAVARIGRQIAMELREWTDEQRAPSRGSVAGGGPLTPGNPPTFAAGECTRSAGQGDA